MFIPKLFVGIELIPAVFYSPPRISTMLKARAHWETLFRHLSTLENVDITLMTVLPRDEIAQDLLKPYFHSMHCQRLVNSVGWVYSPEGLLLKAVQECNGSVDRVLHITADPRGCVPLNRTLLIDPSDRFSTREKRDALRAQHPGVSIDELRVRDETLLRVGEIIAELASADISVPDYLEHHSLLDCAQLAFSGNMYSLRTEMSATQMGALSQRQIPSPSNKLPVEGPCVKGRLGERSGDVDSAGLLNAP